jgi:DNA polymerase III epsilon subunit-like protein
MLPKPAGDGKRVFYVYDVETTGSQRALDQVIEISMLAVEEGPQDGLLSGSILGTFKERVNNFGKNITTKGAFKVHGISLSIRFQI